MILTAIPLCQSLQAGSDGQQSGECLHPSTAACWQETCVNTAKNGEKIKRFRLL